jgi:preprotein translocase subunit SecG
VVVVMVVVVVVVVICCLMQIPEAARSKAWVYGRSLTGIVGSNPA